MKEVRTEIRLDAPPERVWHVFTDLAAFKDWNPFIKEADGDLKVGAKLRLHLQPPGGKGMKFSPMVLSVVANKEVSWQGHIPMIFTGLHEFTLERIGENATRFSQHSSFSGLATKFFGGDFFEGMRSGFEAMERAMEERVKHIPS